MSKSIYSIASIVFVTSVFTNTLMFAQSDTTLVDSASASLNMDAVYNRPFLTSDKMPVAIGGYIEVNTQHSSTDGIQSLFTFQMRRTTLFASSTIASRLKFLLELEFENGVQEINLEYAALDLEFHRLLVMRAGILMNPIGAFNQNHDGPKWEFIDRPLSATTIIPSTLSNVGMGLHGKYSQGAWVVGYEAYLTNGFNDDIIDNDESRTSLAAGKEDPTRFIENPSGRPMFTGKLAVRNRSIGEIGLSMMTGTYGTHTIDGLIVNESRSVTVLAVDANVAMLDNRLRIQGECAKVYVDVPPSFSQVYGSQQFGAYIDVIGTILQTRMFEWNAAQILVSLRGEYVDYNQDTFRETGDPIGDHVWSLTAGLSWRPVGTTVVRFNYRYEGRTDLFGNPPSNTAAIQFGLSTYF
ncbi:MAG: outer membrane beta-barrel protein [Candidatus Kapabacteria bacterium]|nr:outer membrane beta-barrel protein [Candidatus Kapabacteria bacterium]